MRAETKVTVDSQSYTVTMFPASKGLKLFIRLSKIAGEPLMKAFLLDSAMEKDSKKSRSEEDKKKALMNAAVQSVMGGLFDKLDPDDMLDLVKQVLEQTLVADTSESCTEKYEVRFAGKQKHMWKVFGASLKVQFADFFDGSLS